MRGRLRGALNESRATVATAGDINLSFGSFSNNSAAGADAVGADAVGTDASVRPPSTTPKLSLVERLREAREKRATGF